MNLKSTYSDPHLLTISGVTKRFGSLVAVNNVSLDIRPGEIFALLGANGAGKTTLIGCVCGVINRFEGDIRVAGHDVLRDFQVTRQLVGLVPQELNFDGFFQTKESLCYQGAFFGRRRNEERADELLRAFSLEEKASASTRALSGGMKRRLMICKALMHEPVLLFLDEPTAGVDVELREELWNYILRLRDSGVTIVLTTHYLEEAERLADRIGIINRGRLLRVAPREELLRTFARRWIEVELSAEAPERLLARLADLNARRMGPARLRIEFRDGDLTEQNGAPIERLHTAIEEEGLSIVVIEGGRSRLEEIFRELVASDLPEKEALSCL